MLLFSVSATSSPWFKREACVCRCVVCRCVCVRQRQRNERERRERWKISNLTRLSEGIPWRSPCTILATLKQIWNFIKVKLLKQKTQFRSVPPSAAGAQRQVPPPQVLSALKEVSDRSEQAVWMEEWTDRQTRALTASLSWTNRPEPLPPGHWVVSAKKSSWRPLGWALIHN